MTSRLSMRKTAPASLSDPPSLMSTIPDPWYARQAEQPLDPALLELAEDEAAFFKAQTGLTDDGALRAHILAVQRKAFAVWPYPCIRRVRTSPSREFESSEAPRQFAFTKCALNGIAVD